MTKHFFPPGLNIKEGDEIGGWKLAYIEPQILTETNPREIEENETPDYYFFVIYKRLYCSSCKKRIVSIPGNIPYQKLFHKTGYEFIYEFIQMMGSAYAKI